MPLYLADGSEPAPELDEAVEQLHNDLLDEGTDMKVGSGGWAALLECKFVRCWCKPFSDVNRCCRGAAMACRCTNQLPLLLVLVHQQHLHKETLRLLHQL